MASGSITWDNPIPGNIERLYPGLSRAIEAATAKKASDAQSYMRVNASWQDQTGNARNGLFARPFADEGHFGINLFHTVPYGIWLEVRFSGRYAIIDPTLPVMGHELMALLNGIMRKVGIGA